MGRLNADAFAGEVREGNIDRSAALSWHLQSNHYPPHPHFMVAVADAAIDKANAGEWDEFVTLPEGVQWKGREDSLAPVYGVIESLHLESFLDQEEDF
ncbi:MAG: hypothetical protein H0W63_03980 [Gemmatimonadaceae bacterium]|nr:hypothetical protein [Gemmatimonadaceae bacterium]